MSPQHLALEIRNAYEGHDRERLERALAELVGMKTVEEVAIAAGRTDFYYPARGNPAHAGFCVSDGICNCGGDTPAVRAGCAYFKRF